MRYNILFTNNLMNVVVKKKWIYCIRFIEIKLQSLYIEISKQYYFTVNVYTLYYK